MNTPDIDIERLRGARDSWQKNGLTVEFLADMTYNHRVALLAMADFLVSLADQDGELWMETPCEHGWMLCGDSDCDGGSRVRVWPKEGE